MPGKLYLVATPIGNLQDMTFRAVEVLRAVDVIACEDTRHTRHLLDHFRVSARVVSYHEHNEKERAEELADRLVAGGSVAVVSDAGTPGICDPAYRIVSRAVGEARKIEGHAFDEPLFLDRIALVGDVKRRLRQVKARHW